MLVLVLVLVGGLVVVEWLVGEMGGEEEEGKKGKKL